MMEQAEHPILIRPEELSPEAIEGVIENFILREGTGLVKAEELSYGD